jgi:hypothetical protein
MIEFRSKNGPRRRGVRQTVFLLAPLALAISSQAVGQGSVEIIGSPLS